jgi:hypothetical protein
MIKVDDAVVRPHIGLALNDPEEQDVFPHEHVDEPEMHMVDTP